MGATRPRESKPGVCRGGPAVLAAAAVLAMNGAAAAGDVFTERFAARHAALSADDVRDRFKLARWAEARGLTRQAMRTYREVLVRDDDHKLAYKHWVDLASAHAPPVDADRRRALRRSFPSMKLHATKHFLVLYDADEAF